MKITGIHLRNFLVFAGEFDAEFCAGINVLVGGNATGKTTILKCIYAACEFSNDMAYPNKTKKFQHFFTPSNDLKRDTNQKTTESGHIHVFGDEHDFHFRLWDKFIIGDWLKLGIKSVFIPSKEMLSHSKGLVAMSQKYGVPFDGTQIDILINAQLWETKEISDRNQKILDILGKAIDGEVVYENDMFYVVKNSGLKIEYSLEAEGLKRIGLLWKLIRNGLLESGSVLLWDEPEISLNPELVPVLVDILLELAQSGVQIFVASHDYNLVRYFDVRKVKEIPVLFHNLVKTNNGQIARYASAKYHKIPDNHIEKAGEELFVAVSADMLGVQSYDAR